jgi:hypothetical protein
MGRPRLTDTSRDALEAMSALYAKMTPEEKLRRVRELTRAASRLALIGLRMRHPDETDAQLRVRLAHIRLGEKLAEQVYPDSATRGGV